MDPLANEPLLKHWRDATCGGATDKITVTKGEVWKLIDRAADAVTAELQIVRLTAAADALRAAQDALLHSLTAPPPESPASAPSRGTDHDPGEMDCTCIAPHPACPNCNGTGRYQR